MTNVHALELRGVHAGYGGIEVLRDVSLAVPYGGVLALLGPNGGGKSTLLRVVAGQLAPTAGDVVIGGQRVNGARPADLARRGVCLVPEGRGIFPNLTVRENLWLVTHAGVARERVEAVAYEQFPILGERRRQLAGSLSGGEQQMLAMARALATDPVLLLLDELSMGLAPIVVAQLYELVGRIARGGTSIVVVEQFARAVLGIADRVGVVQRGQVTCFDDRDAIEADLSSVYFGARVIQ